MRSMSEARRRAIMQAAAEVFNEQGFAGASMATIAARVGGSKATLYRYFPTKEELFIAVTLETMEATSDALLQLLASEISDIRAALTEFGRAYLALLTRPEVVTTTRIGVSQGIPAGVAQALYTAGPERGWRFVAKVFERLDAQGIVRVQDPIVAALQLKSLLESGVFEPLLFGMDPILSPHTMVDHAVETFLARYGVK